MSDSKDLVVEIAWEMFEQWVRQPMTGAGDLMAVLGHALEAHDEERFKAIWEAVVAARQ